MGRLNAGGCSKLTRWLFPLCATAHPFLDLGYFMFLHRHIARRNGFTPMRFLLSVRPPPSPSLVKYALLSALGCLKGQDVTMIGLYAKTYNSTHERAAHPNSALEVSGREQGMNPMQVSKHLLNSGWLMAELGVGRASLGHARSLIFTPLNINSPRR